MSPEQIRGDAVMPASDVFSLGSVLAFAATGRPPFGSDTAATVMFRIVGQPPDLAGLADQELRMVIEACLAKTPADRPAVQAVLTALTRHGPVPAILIPRTPRHAAPAADGPGTQTRTHPGRSAIPGPGMVPPRMTSPPEPLHARRSAGRPRRRRAALITAVAAVAALAAAIPVLLTAGHPAASPRPGSTITPRNLTLHSPGGAGLRVITFSPDGRLLAFGGEQGKPTYVWNIVTGTHTALTDPGTGGINAVAISPDGKLLADADSNQTVYLWNLATGKLAATLDSPRAGANPAGVAFSPDGKLLAVGEDSGTDLWDVATGKLIKALRSGGSGTVAFSPDGKLLATSGDNPFFLWDVATGKRYATLYNPVSDGISDVAFSTDGKVVAAADNNGSAYLFNVATDALIATITAPPQDLSPNKNVTGITFSPDGTLMATADADGHAYLWNTATHKHVGTFTDPTLAQVFGVAFSPDGATLAICDLDGNVYVRITSHLVS